jgi:hypothetical protein
VNTHDPPGFEVPADVDSYEIEVERDLPLVESQLLVIGDESRTDDLVEHARPYMDGSAEWLSSWICTEAFTLCSTTWDGELPLRCFTRDREEAWAAEIEFDDVDPWGDTWIPAGFTSIPSGIAIVADPSFLEQYVSDPLHDAVTAAGVWTILRLPGPGSLAVHVRKRRGDMEEHNVAVRVTYVN